MQDTFLPCSLEDLLRFSRKNRTALMENPPICRFAQRSINTLAEPGVHGPSWPLRYESKASACPLRRIGFEKHVRSAPLVAASPHIRWENAKRQPAQAHMSPLSPGV